jgi:hypothetical protein
LSSSLSGKVLFQELNRAVKPFMFQHLLRMGHETVLYFDPDIQIFSRLNQILEPLQDGGKGGQRVPFQVRLGTAETKAIHSPP